MNIKAASFDCLDHALPVHGKYFLEASAGTGKTFAIQQIVTRLLIQSPAISLPEILVVTFTRAATRELKLRIRSNIEQVLNEIKYEKNSLGFDYVSKLLVKDAAEKNTVVTRLEQALHSFEQAQIYTIHGFCNAMLSKYAFEADFSFEAAQSEDPGPYKAVLTKLLHHFLSSLPQEEISSSQMYLVLKEYKQDFKAIVEEMMQILQKNASFPSFPNFSQAVHKINDLLRNFPDTHFEQVFHDFSQLALCYRELSVNASIKPHYLRQIKLWSKVLERKSLVFEELEELIEDSPFCQWIQEENLRKRAVLPVLHYPDLIEKFKHEIQPFILQLRQPKFILLKLAESAKSFIESNMEGMEVFSPDDLLKKMQKNLSNLAFVEKVRKNFSAVIIDEFQDTDVYQWEIFSKLFLHPSLKAFYLVGDPKQSIYSFRNADLDTYFLAADSMGKENIAYLDTNFRSQKTLVHALNGLFSDGKWLQMLPERKNIWYQPVNAGIKEEPKKNYSKAPLHFFLTINSSGKKQTWPTPELEDRQIFPFIAKEILTLVKQQQYSFQDIVILVKDRYTGQKLQDFLNKQHIPCFSKGILSLAETSAFTFLENLLYAVSFPGNINTIKQLLIHPFINIPIQKIEKDFHHPDILNILKDIHFLHNQFKENGLYAFFQRFFQMQIFRENILEKILAQGIENFQEVMQLAELLMQQEIQGPLQPLRALNFLKKLKTKEIDQVPELKKRNLSSGEMVAIMTVHASKGLEFPIVFALGIAYRTPSMNEIMVAKQKKVWQIFHENQPDCLEYLAEKEEEKTRNLYVALTRAKQRLYIPIFIDTEKKLPPLGRAAPVELFLARRMHPNSYGRKLYEHIAALNKEEVTAFLDDLSAKYAITYSVLPEEKNLLLEKPQSKEHSDLLSPPSISFSYTKQEIYSFSRMAKHGQLEINHSTENAKEFFHALPKGSLVGRIIHLIFEKILQRGLMNPYQKTAIENIVKNSIMNTELEKHQEEMQDLVQKSLQTPLHPFSFSIADVPSSNIIQEMEFLYPILSSSFKELSKDSDQKKEGYMKGYIDLFFEMEGRYFIVDWKSNYLGPNNLHYNADGLKAAMEENEYFLQASIYKEAVEKYLALFQKKDLFGGMFYFFLRGLYAENNGIFYLE